MLAAVPPATPPKPLVGVAMGFHEFGDYLGVGHQRPVALAGGVPVMLPRLEDSLEDLLDAISGLVLTGGRDIVPSHYGHEPHELLGTTDPGRDAFELELTRRAMARGMPIIGICRGMQVLNVAMGGTLVQDVGLVDEWAAHPSDPTLASWHSVVAASLADDALPEHPRHGINVEPDSHLHRALGVREIDVSSFHHQAIGTVGDGLRVSARADDGVVEALEADGWVLAMQCELHEEWRVRPAFLDVYRHFVAAAAAFAGSSS